MFEIKDGKLVLDERSQRILAEQTIPPRYGFSPAMQALPLIEAINTLPANERAEAAEAYVSERLSDPNDEWWD